MKLRAAFLGGGSFLVGTIIIVLGLWAHWERHLAQSWSRVPAEITSSKVSSWRGSRGATSYRPCIIYRYTVTGVSYTGDTVRFGPVVVGRDEAEESVRIYAVGQRAIIYVNPTDASQSVLDRDRVTGAVASQLIAGIGLAVAGMVLGIALWKA